MSRIQRFILFEKVNKGHLKSRIYMPTTKNGQILLYCHNKILKGLELVSSFQY